jgi:hypothetical protein
MDTAFLIKVIRFTVNQLPYFFHVIMKDVMLLPLCPSVSVFVPPYNF